MKSTFLILFAIALFSFTACDETGPTISTGEIFGPEITSCTCCGGYLIFIDKFTYRFFASDLPAGSTLLTNASFPMKVELFWENQNIVCNDVSRISISQIAKK